MDLVDKIIKEIDQGLKFSLQNYQKQSREYPAKGIEDDSLNEIDRSISASLMELTMLEKFQPKVCIEDKP